MATTPAADPSAAGAAADEARAGTHPASPEAWYGHVRIGECHIALPVGHVVRAVPPPAAGLTTLPRRQASPLVGIVDFEGSAVPVVALDRWVPIGTGGDPDDARIVVLRDGSTLLAIQVDALAGMKRVDAGAVRRIHQADDAEELFEAVLPATADRPLLCVLEVGRLKALVGAWCDGIGLRPAESRTLLRQRQTGGIRHAVIVAGSGRWALPALAVAELARTPTIELRRRGQRICGICEWQGRKLPMVDLDAAARQPGAALPRWMLIVVLGPLAMALVAKCCDSFLDLVADDIALLPGDDLLAGTTAVAKTGLLPVIDVEKLFRSVPEALISKAPVAANSKRPAPGAALPAGRNHYLVFETDRRYASPVEGMVGVVDLPPRAIADLAAGRRTNVAWRGRTVPVMNLPSIDGQSAAADPLLAVILEAPGEDRCFTGIAVKGLCDWLPAQALRHGGLRSHSAGEISMITVQRGDRSMSLVVVDLPQMAYLLN